MSNSEPTRRKLARLARLVAETAPEEIDCGTVIDYMAEYLEAVRAGVAVPEDLALVAQHLRVCPECAEEYEALAELDT